MSAQRMLIKATDSVPDATLSFGSNPVTVKATLFSRNIGRSSRCCDDGSVVRADAASWARQAKTKGHALLQALEWPAQAPEFVEPDLSPTSGGLRGEVALVPTLHAKSPKSRIRRFRMIRRHSLRNDMHSTLRGWQKISGPHVADEFQSL
jgi:hypothetical protein